MFQRIFSRFGLLAALALPLGFAASSCTDKEGNPLLFSLEDDIALGDQVAAETDSTYRAQGKLLERSTHARAYQLLDGVVNRVLNSSDIQHRNDFAWDVKIIKEDSTQNAFATPGGHIYVFTGLIKYLDDESQLAGVLGHEIAHADRRHTSRQLQNQYGIQLLLSVALGNSESTASQIASGLAGLGTLKFSRDFENEADQYSVIYLNGPGYYACDGAAGFFIKAQSQGQASPPEFLSTHPNPDNRIQAIQTKATELNCRNRTVNSSGLRELQGLL
ncbi:M48 family metalloprotease [Hymenobacter sp. 15J16-1T3B]|uniref:M48 family metalloprotease n=1 Tax=Hymenobacter sp. 15J16-1T3B TaxID=2886941 RepID=UPI001D0FA433|nr:M48 family metalloprotease [Hymenobacter sp. 15J16-1T3B]MCC3157140.1 M48 family metalloprotease [Hymenobacter sp. 15J16-1T3B]